MSSQYVPEADTQSGTSGELESNESSDNSKPLQGVFWKNKACDGQNITALNEKKTLLKSKQAHTHTHAHTHTQMLQ